MLTRVAIFVDIQGFSYFYLHDRSDWAHTLLYRLMEDLNKLRIGERIGIHQVGDGFLIIDDGRDLSRKDLGDCIAISIALQRSLLLNGGCIKCSISYGDFADVQGMYPEGVKEQGFGRGIMTTFTVMGSALIRAYGCDKLASGPLLIVDAKLEAYIPKNGLITSNHDNHIQVDWIHSDFPPVIEVLKRIKQPRIHSGVLEMRLEDYLKAFPKLPERWVEGAKSLLMSDTPKGVHV